MDKKKQTESKQEPIEQSGSFPLQRWVMPHSQLRLKARLKLKRLRKLIDMEVEWNFGYCPNTESFDALIAERTQWEDMAKEHFPDVYKEHHDISYCGA